MIKKIVPIALLMLGGCSLMPYENEFACRMKNNMGKCISVADAYEEAVTGESKGPYLVPASEQDEEAQAPVETKPLLAHQKNKDQFQSAVAPTPVVKPETDKMPPPEPVIPAYPGYRDAVYTKLKGLIDQPQAPMVAAPRTVRTMILPYTSTLDRNRLWMPRYVYNIVKEPYFIMGEYLTNEREADIINTVQE